MTPSAKPAGAPDRAATDAQAPSAAPRGGLWQIDLAGTAALLVMTAALLLLGVQPLLESRAVKGDLEIALTNEKNAAVRSAADARALQKQIDQTREQIRQSQVRLTDPNQINTRLGQITDLAAVHGLSIDSVRQDKPEDGPRYRTLRIHVQGRGDYASCTAFLHALNQSFKDVGVDAMSLAAGTERDRADGTSQNRPTVAFWLDLALYLAPGDKD